MRKSGAFTLIELLVVIAIIALLMGILIPTLNKARNMAQGAACKANLKNYTLAVQMYLDDNEQRFPEPATCYFSQATAFPVESGLSSYIHVRWCNGNVDLKSHPEYGGNLFPYLASAKAFICPTYKTAAVRNSEDHFYQADAANIGKYERNSFAAMVEFGVNLRRRFTCGLEGTFGYTVFYLGDVARAGDQIDFDLNLPVTPPIPPIPPLGPLRPAFSFNTTDFWAHGLHLGLDYAF